MSAHPVLHRKNGKPCFIFLILTVTAALLIMSPSMAGPVRDEAHRYSAAGPVYEGFTWVVRADPDAADPEEEGTWYIMDIHGNLLTDESLRLSNRYFSEGLLTVWKDSKAGCIDVRGDMVIPFEFDDIYDFFQGVAVAKKDGLWGLISTRGETLLPFEWDQVSFRGPGIYEVRKDRKYGFADASGDFLIPCVLDSVGYGWHDERLLVCYDGTYGYIDPQGRLAILPRWTGAFDFSDGMARVFTGEAYGYIDTEGVLQFTLPRSWYASAAFSDGLLRVDIDRSGRIGYLDRTGAIVIPFRQWEEATDFEEGYAKVLSNGKWGLINTYGEQVIPCEWDEIRIISSTGLFFVGKEDRHFLIRPDGTVVLDLGQALVYSFSGHDPELLLVDQETEAGRKLGLIRTDGTWICECQWDSLFDRTYPILHVEREENGQTKVGYMNPQGEMIVPCEYDTGYFSDGYFTLIRNGYLTFLDRDGNVIW